MLAWSAVANTLAVRPIILLICPLGNCVMLVTDIADIADADIDVMFNTNGEPSRRSTTVMASRELVADTSSDWFDSLDADLCSRDEEAQHWCTFPCLPLVWSIICTAQCLT